VENRENAGVEEKSFVANAVKKPLEVAETPSIF
jgi:hypothetical protein